VTEDYLRRCGVGHKLDHGVDNMAMAMSLVASTRGLALMPAYAKNLMPSSGESFRAPPKTLHRGLDWTAQLGPTSARQRP
jgi:hypothetical protein